MILAPHSANVTIAFGQLNSVVKWCNTYCESYWDFEITELPDAEGGRYQFNFESDRDAVKFAMWQQ